MLKWFFEVLFLMLDKGEDTNKHDCILVTRLTVILCWSLTWFTSEPNFTDGRRRQQRMVATYICALYDLASTCLFNDKEARIRDQLVIGISESKTSKKLQLQDDLELAGAIDICRTREQISDQMARLSSNANLDSVTKRKSSRRLQTRLSGQPEVKSLRSGEKARWWMRRMSPMPMQQRRRRRRSERRRRRCGLQRIWTRAPDARKIPISWRTMHKVWEERTLCAYVP